MAGPVHLVSDIGGTNIRVACFENDPRERTLEINYRDNPATGEAWDIIDALADYRSRLDEPIVSACLGLAGRVRDGGQWVALTNRPGQTLRRDDLGEILGIRPDRLRLINDMPPHLACVDLLHPDELRVVRPGRSEPGGTRAIVMPGSGLGVGFAPFVHDRHHPTASEGGHLDFAPRTAQQDRLVAALRTLARKEGLPNLSFEYVLSGPGLRRLHAALLNPDAPDLSDAPAAHEITAVAGRDDLPPDEPRRRTLLTFVELLGQMVANVALVTCATGGVYLGGTIALSLRDELSSPAFTDALLNSGPTAHRPMLEEIPVTLIDYKESGLLGAGVLAMQMG